MNPLLAIYPRAVLSDTCCTAEDVFCFYDEKRRVYVTIPKEDIAPKEKLLLESFLTPAEEKGDFFPETAAAKRWRRFLLEEGPVPDVKEPRVRFIHYDLLRERDWGAFTEALRHFWPVSYTVVRTGRDQGVIVEEEKLEAPDSDDIASFVKILEGDFYFSVRFFHRKVLRRGRTSAPSLSERTAILSDWPATSPAAEHADRGNGISGHAHGRKQRKALSLASRRSGAAVSERTGAEAYDSDFY